MNPSTSPPLEADEVDAFEISGTGSSNSELQIENPAIIRRRRRKRRRERGIMKSQRRGIEKGVLEDKWGWNARFGDEGREEDENREELFVALHLWRKKKLA